MWPHIRAIRHNHTRLVLGKKTGHPVIASPTPPIFLKHYHRHRIPQLPDHFYRPFALKADSLTWAEIGERNRAVVAPFLVAGKKENGVTPRCVVYEVLAGC